MPDDEEFKQAVRRNKVPILVLDQKWHRLFDLSGKTDEIIQLEHELNELLASQGKVNSQIKELKNLKAKLMENVVWNMEGTTENTKKSLSRKKLDADKRLLDDINVKLDECEDLMLELPHRIKEKNEELMFVTIEYCYQNLRINQEEISKIAEWIRKIRIELKKNVIQKQNLEINSKEIYAYMHDIFGAQVIDLFDLEYENEQIDTE